MNHWKKHANISIAHLLLFDPWLSFKLILLFTRVTKDAAKRSKQNNVKSEETDNNKEDKEVGLSFQLISKYGLSTLVPSPVIVTIKKNWTVGS